MMWYSMGLIKLFLVLTFIYCVLSDEKMHQRCNTNRTDYSNCIKGLMQEFFKNYGTVDPENDIKSTDPVTIQSITENQEDIGMSAEYTNVKASGFKNVVVSDIKTDSKNKYSEMTMKFDLISEGDIAIGVTATGKTYHGTFRYVGSIDGVAEYNYGLKEENNMEYYTFAPETVKCVADNEKGLLNPELYEALDKDSEAKIVSDKFKPIATDYYERVLCKIATVVIKTAVNNMRAVGRKGIHAA